MQKAISGLKKGSYTAYGQMLNITRGIISFNGAVVNIRAMRNAVNNNASLTSRNAERVRDNAENTGSNFSQNTTIRDLQAAGAVLSSENSLPLQT